MEKLIEMLHRLQCSCVIANCNNITVCHERGVKDLLRLLKTSPATLEGASIADRIIGKGAAALMILGRVRDVYADIISETAVELFSHTGIKVSWGECVPEIINRAGTGRCPVETLTQHCTTADECLPLIENFVDSMSNQ